MSHHLRRNVHQEIHEAHCTLDGMWSSRQVTAKVRLADFHDEEHRRLVQALALKPHRQRTETVELTISICAECGYIEGTTCQHGMSYWTHRTGCPKYDPTIHEFPEGLVRHYKDAIGPRTDPNCSGCLLLCPVCKADGT